MTALLVYPTHQNGQEIEAEYLNAGLSAACYPRRIVVPAKDECQNCWNPEADDAEQMGFAVVKAVCAVCRHQNRCKADGYLRELIDVKDAVIAICTHKRAEFTGLANLMQDRLYVSIHENAINILRPPVSVTEADLTSMLYVLNRLLDDPKFLDWFGDDLQVDDEGNRYHDAEVAIRKERQYDFARLLLELAESLLRDLQQAEKTVRWQPSATAKVPNGIERLLYFAVKVSGAKFAGQPWRFLLAAAGGELHSAAILVHARHQRGGGKGRKYVDKRAYGARCNLPSADATVWFNDATMSADRLRTILGRSVHNETPVGQLELQKKAVQIPRDITRKTSSRTFCSLLRGVMVDRPQFRRLGLITHRPLVPFVDDLESEYRERIVKISYFGSGEDRSSNEWHTQCDLIIVAGTPRVPPAAVANYLVQIGDVAAACEPAEWAKLIWYGQTESGETVKVQSRGYQDELWRAANRDLVRAALVQAVGRGRGILETGCEVLVLSTEECGLVLSDGGLEAFSGRTDQVLTALKELTQPNANKYYLGNGCVSTRLIAERLGVSTTFARRILTGLERRGLVQKVGERSGWRLVGSESFT